MPVQPATRYHPFDALTTFTEGVTMTANGFVQEDGEDVIIDLGAGRTDADLIIDVKGRELASEARLYLFLLQGSQTPSFSTTTLQNLAFLEIGGSARHGGAKTSPVGLYQVPFHNADPDGEFQYTRLYLRIAGPAAPSITFSAFISPRM